MQSIQLKTRVGPDGILQLNVPVEFKDTDLEVMLVFQPLPTAVRVPNSLANQNETLSETQVRLAKVRQKYEGRTFQDSVELLREDRQR